MKHSSKTLDVPAPTSVSSPASRCPTCDSDHSHVLSDQPADYEYGVTPQRTFRFLRCCDCETEWLDPRPDVAEMRSFYPEGYHAYHDDHGRFASVLVAVRARMRTHQYRSLLPPGESRLFDIGAGDCRHFEELSSIAGLQCAGVEINPVMAALARSRGYDVEVGTLEEMDITRHEGRYHAVSMNHVLEHVLEPVEVARRCFRLLAPGGRLIGQLPTLSSWEHKFFGASWAGYHFPRHLQIFSRTGLARLLASAGFEEVRIRSTPHIQTALSTQNWLVSRDLGGRLEFGRARYFAVLLGLSLPIEIAACLANRSGVVNFEARRSSTAT